MKSQTATPYDEKFYGDILDGALRSARAVVPLVLDLIPAKSVVDFGCGQGAWLKAFLEGGVETVLGLDGDYVDRDKLLIAGGQFRAADLQRSLRLDRQFDLALCLEVAEHLPARSAPVLVESLAAAAPVVLFSAALPKQEGTSHINEQWPAYWEGLFSRQGMRKYDVIRPLIWHDRSIEWWYRQNIYVYSTEERSSLNSLAHFEPEMSLVSREVMTAVTFPWRARVWKCLAVLRGIRSRLYRFN